MQGNTYLNSYSAKEQTNLDPFDHMDSFQNFRVLKNLGSQVKSVVPYENEDRVGYQVIYGGGDRCLADPTRHYESMVNYQCDPDHEINDD